MSMSSWASSSRRLLATATLDGECMKDLMAATDSAAVVFVTWMPSSDDEGDESDREVLLRVGVILAVTTARV